jgi:hypothetical protein
MKSMTYFLAPAALVVLFVAHSNAQSQTGAKTDSPAAASTPKVQAPAVTSADKTPASPSPAAVKSSQKSALARKSRKTPPPPPLTSIRHKRAVKKTNPGMTGDRHATELDPHGRLDNAGKNVGFYPSVRGTPSNKSQSSANRTGRKFGKPKT